MRYLLLLAVACLAGCTAVTAPDKIQKQVYTGGQDAGGMKPDVSQAAMAKSYSWLCACLDSGVQFSNVDWICLRIRLASGTYVWAKEPCDGKYTPGVKDLPSREGYRIRVYVSQCGNRWIEFTGADQIRQFLIGPGGACSFQLTPVTIQH